MYYIYISLLTVYRPFFLRVVCTSVCFDLLEKYNVYDYGYSVTVMGFVVITSIAVT